MNAFFIHEYFRKMCEELASKYSVTVEFEHRFHPVRKWRFDAAFIQKKIAIELDGAVYAGGRHTRGAGFVKDCEKINEAQLMGWKVLRFIPSQLVSGEMNAMIERALR